MTFARFDCKRCGSERIINLLGRSKLLQLDFVKSPYGLIHLTKLEQAITQKHLIDWRLSQFQCVQVGLTSAIPIGLVPVCIAFKRKQISAAIGCPVVLLLDKLVIYLYGLI